jgi:antitoxin component YwqK of YwqJK toxin-antitoxin module
MRLAILLIALSMLSCPLAAGAQETMPDGVHRTYYVDGKVSVEENYEGGKRNGVFRKYAPDGTLIQENIYNHGVLLDASGTPINGHHKDYFDYSAWQEDNYKDGLLEGVCQAVDDNGHVLFERKFSKGKVIAYRAVAQSVQGPHKWTPLK